MHVEMTEDRRVADGARVADPARLRHEHPVTPHAGRPLAGVVVFSTWLHGTEITGDEAHGRLLSRGGV